MFSPDKKIYQKTIKRNIAEEDQNNQQNKTESCRKKFSMEDVNEYRKQHLKEWKDWINFDNFVLRKFGTNPLDFLPIKS